MSIYFFNVVCQYRSYDDTGTECLGIQAARAEAMRTVGEMLQEITEDLSDDAEWRMEVTDDQARVIFVVRIVTETKIARQNHLS